MQIACHFIYLFSVPMSPFKAVGTNTIQCRQVAAVTKATVATIILLGFVFFVSKIYVVTFVRACAVFFLFVFGFVHNYNSLLQRAHLPQGELCKSYGWASCSLFVCHWRTISIFRLNDFGSQDADFCRNSRSSTLEIVSTFIASVPR